jgi:uncharacterized protein (DUF58 family)
MTLVTLVITVALVWPPAARLVLPLDALLLIAFAWDGRRARDVHIEARRKWPPLLLQGQTAEVEVEIRSHARDAVTLLLREGLHPAVAGGPQRQQIVLSPGCLAIWTYRVMPRRRGDHEIAPLTVRILGPWRLAWHQRDLLAPASIRVYPQVHWGGRVGRLLLLAQRRELGQSPLPVRGLGTEPYALREYRPGDPPGKIHWKATARHARPITREETWERGARLLILLDAGRSMASVTPGGSKLDAALAATLALTRVAAARGDRVTILAFSDRVQRLVRLRADLAGASEAYLRLFNLKARLVESAYDLAALEVERFEPRRSTVVLFTSVVDLASADILRSALKTLSRRHRVLLANLEDSELTALARGIPKSGLEALAQVSALEVLLANRRLAIRLRRAGIRVVAAPTDRLALETLNVYLAFQRGRLTRWNPPHARLGLETDRAAATR